jgi:hypothetical protein
LATKKWPTDENMWWFREFIPWPRLALFAPLGRVP